jgi:hypothetical protein
MGPTLAANAATNAPTASAGASHVHTGSFIFNLKVV